MKGDFQPRPESKSRNNKIRPVSRYANVELAQECFKNGKELQKKQTYDKAIDQYLRALMYDPNYFQAYCNMGTCYRSQGKYLESRSMYLKSISIKNDDAISHYNLANVQRIIGNYQSSINHYEFVIKLGESGGQNIGSLFVNSLINLGICYKITQQYDRAIECYEKAKKIDTNDEAIIYNQAMVYMAILQTINIDIFQEVSKERAAKAEILLNQLLKSNPKHEMANVKLCRVSCILDKSNINLNKNVTKLKEMLSNDKSTLKDQINSQLGYILKLLKQYQQSATHYNQSFNKAQQKISNKVIEANVYDSGQGYLNTKITVFSEQQAIRTIKQGNIDEVKQSLIRMDDSNISKHVIQLAIQLQLAQNESQDHFKKAVQIYNKYFKQNNKEELPFQKVSIEAHKLIGKVLSKQNKYKQSIKHFEYISSQLKSNLERSAVHTSLGSDYEALGDKQKALQQYKLALGEQPQNYQLIYNVGCCLHDRGDHQQSNIYFSKFLELIKKDTKVQMPTKNLYIADCLVTMAGSTTNPTQEFQRYERAWLAIKQVQQGEQQTEVQFDDQKMLNYYLRWADLLEEKMIGISDKKSERYMSSKEALLEVYMCLLQTQGCPDRDAILNNSAILYYEEKLYVNALANLNQVVIQSSLSLNSLALTYLHLGQHYMATKSLYAATQIGADDPIINFNKELIEWVYGISKTGRLYDIFNNQDDSLIFIRWQYAILVIDSLSKKLKYEKDDVIDQQTPSILQKIYENNNVQLSLDQAQKIKYKYIISKLKSSGDIATKSSPNIDQLITFCVTPSHNIQGDLKNLIERLNTNKQLNDTAIELLMNIFIFTNKDKANSIRTYLQDSYKSKQDIYTLQMDRRVTITEDLINKEFTFSNTGDIVVNLCSWECEIQNKLIVLVHFIEKCYYHLSIRHPLQAQYHFPRHNQLQDCGITINRMISLIYNTFKVKTNIHIKEKTISAMKTQLIDEIEADFEIQMRKQSFVSISLGEKLRILTLHANFSSREECGKFIKELQRQCSEKKQIDIRRNQQEIVLLISGIIAVSCTWTERNSLKNAIKSLLKSPLQIYQQSILEIQENLYFIQEPNEKIWQKLSKIQAYQKK